jgi:hypothetical protein
MFEDPEWRQNIPAYFVDEQIGKRNALARILREDMRKIQSLDLTSLAQLDPSSPVFQEEYLTAYKRQREVDDLYNFCISMSAMITNGRLASSCTSERQTFSFPAFQMAVAGRGEFFPLLDIKCTFEGRTLPAGVRLGVHFERGTLGVLADVSEWFGGTISSKGTLITQRWQTGERSNVYLQDVSAWKYDFGNKNWKTSQISV